MTDPAIAWPSMEPARGRDQPPSQPGTRLAHPVKEYNLGILLVHGIGTQASGETLVRWGDKLLKTISRATRRRVLPVAERAGPADADSRGGGAEAVVRLGGGEHEERWLLSEAWWADAFLAPSYRELVSWSLKALPWSVAIHIARRYWRTVGDDAVRSRVVPAGIATAQLLMALALAPILIVLLALALVVGLLPIVQLREAALAAQRALTATVGDSLAFVESPVRAALIRTRILDQLQRLKERCAATIIVAHSQGAAVALEALGGILEPSFADEPAANPEPSGGAEREPAHVVEPAATPAEAGGSATPNETASQGCVPDILVTFGAGTNQLTSLKVLSAGLPAKNGVNAPALAVGALAAVFVLTWWLYSGLNAGRTTLRAIALATALLAASVAVFGFVAWAALNLIGWLASRWNRARLHEDSLIAGTTMVLFFAGLLTVIVYSDREALPLMSVNLLFLALLTLAASIVLILSKNLKTMVTMSVRNPPGLARWIDLYASADPVPNGPTETRQPGVPQSVQVWNRDSALADHTAYWDNADGFVLRVVRECADLATSSWRAELPPDTSAASQRAAWRIGVLRLGRRVIAGAIAASGAVLGVEYWSAILPPIDLPNWLAGVLPASLLVGAMSAWRLSVLVGLVALASWVCTRPLNWVWRAWVRSEQESVLAHREPGGGTLISLTGMGAVVWLVVALELAISRESLSWVGTLLASPSEVFVRLMAVVGLGLLSALALLKLRPAP